MSATNNNSVPKSKVLKVKLPMKQHLTLHKLRLLTGKSISDTVSEAVSNYLGDAYKDVTDGFGTPSGAAGA